MKPNLIVSIVLASASALSACSGTGTGGATDPAPSQADNTGLLALSTTATSATQVALRWSGHIAAGDSYRIYRDGKLDDSVTAVPGGATDTGLSPNTEYCYQMTATDRFGTASSNESCVTTAALAGWDTQDIAAAPLSLALDPRGLERVSYCSQWNGVVYQARRPDGSWDISVVDPTATCFDALLAVGGNGSAHMIYLDEGSNTLKYATDSSGSWVVSEVSGAAGAEFYVMALDDAGYVHLAYQLFTGQAPDTFHIVYTTNASGDWQSQVVAHGDVYPAIAVDGSGAVYIAFLGGPGPDGTYPVHYLSDVSGTWVDSIVATSTDAKSLVTLTVDGAGHGHIAFKAHASLEYASDGSGSWRSIQVDSFDAAGPEHDSYGAYDVSIALDSSQTPHISYEDTSGNLKYGSLTDRDWDIVYVDTQGTQNTLRMDAAGHAHLTYAYFDASLNDLYSKLAVNH